MSDSNSSPADILKKLMKDIKEMDSVHQVVAGGVAGVIAGYATQKLGKMAAFTIGSTVIMLQVAQSSGYVDIRFGKQSKIDSLKKKALKAADAVGLTEPDTQTQVQRALGEVKKFMKNNVTFGASFFGGVLIGFSMG